MSKTVQLITEDGTIVECEQTYLENSLYFKSIIKNLKNANKMLLVPDCKPTELRYIINFMSKKDKNPPAIDNENELDHLIELVTKFQIEELKNLLVEEKQRKKEKIIEHMKKEVKLAFLDAGIQFKKFKTKFSPTSVLEKAIKQEGSYVDKQLFGELSCETTIKILDHQFVAKGVTMAVSRRSAACLALKELFDVEYAEETKLILINASCNKKFLPGLNNSAVQMMKESPQQKAYNYVMAQLRIKKLSSVSPLMTLQTITDRKIDVKLKKTIKKLISCTISWIDVDKKFTAKASNKIEATNLAACAALQEIFQVSFNFYTSKDITLPITLSVALKIDADWKLIIQRVNPSTLDKTIFSQPLTQRLALAMNELSKSQPSRLKSRFDNPTPQLNDKPLLTDSEWKLLEQIDSNAIPDKSFDETSKFGFYVVINDKKILGVGATAMSAKDDLITKAFEFLETLEKEELVASVQGIKRKTDISVEGQPPLKTVAKHETLSWQDKLKKLNEECVKEGKSIRDLSPVKVLNEIGLIVDGNPDNPNVNKIKSYAEETLKKLLLVMGL